MYIQFWVEIFRNVNLDELIVLTLLSFIPCDIGFNKGIILLKSVLKMKALNLLKTCVQILSVKTDFVSPELVFVTRAMSKLKMFAKKPVL